MDDGLIERLATLSEKLQTAGYECRVSFQLPTAERWQVSPGLPPKQVALSTPTSSGIEIEFLSEDAYSRFLSGTFIPQQEVLSGAWSIQGTGEDTMKVTQLLFEG